MFGVEVIVDGAAGYEAVRRPQIARFHDVRPAAVLRCRSAADVVEALDFAKTRGMEIAIRGGGHCFAGQSTTTGAVIDVGPIDSVSLDGGVVTVGGGARLEDIYDALAPHQRTIAGGCGPTVGIAGLALGGGLGILGRRHGLTCDQLVAAEVVLADGRVITCSNEHHDDLFWALRGAGGGQFGVVTSLTLRTVPAPPAITCFHLTWPADHAAELIDAWQRWAPDAPDEIAASLVVRPAAVHLFGAGVDVQPPLHNPTTETFRDLPYRGAKRWLTENGPPEQEGDGYIKSEFFRDHLPTDAIAALTDHFADGADPRELDFSPWGGAYNRTAPGATAFPHRNERFLLKQTGRRDWLTRSYEITHPHGSGGAYVNFPDPDLPDWETAYYGANHDRLRRIKAEYDPENVFRLRQRRSPLTA
jgi:FAD/FMN-containing dehydrogenase